MARLPLLLRPLGRDHVHALAVEGKFGPKEARGKLNGGGEPLRCETVNGTIRLLALK